MSKTEVLARESRWSIPAAVAAFLAVALMIAAQFANPVSGTGDAEVLRSAHEHGSTALLTGVLQAVAFALFAVPLVYLFQAARARSERVRSQLIGLVVAAPLLLALFAVLASAARQEAADQFVAGEARSTLSKREAKKECASDRRDEGKERFAEEFEPKKGETALAVCERRKLSDDQASNALQDASLTSLVSGLFIAGSLGFAIALVYTCLWAMRTGLLTRFWGSLGMALGVVVVFGLILFMFFALIWFIYLGFLLLGFVPGGRPPAWETGEAIPWPTPGERAAAELEPRETQESPERLERKQRD